MNNSIFFFIYGWIVRVCQQSFTYYVVFVFLKHSKPRKQVLFAVEMTVFVGSRKFLLSSFSFYQQQWRTFADLQRKFYLNVFANDKLYVNCLFSCGTHAFQHELLLLSTLIRVFLKFPVGFCWILRCVLCFFGSIASYYQQ